MKIKALQPFSTGELSMEQYEVKIVEDALGAFLVRKKVAVELKGTNGDILFVTSHMEGREYIVIDCPWKVINEAALVIIQSGVNRKYVYATEYRDGVIMCMLSILRHTAAADSGRHTSAMKKTDIRSIRYKTKGANK